MITRALSRVEPRVSVHHWPPPVFVCRLSGCQRHRLMDTMDATGNPATSAELPEESFKAQQQEDDDIDMESQSGGPINSEETVRLLVAVVDEGRQTARFRC